MAMHAVIFVVSGLYMDFFDLEIGSRAREVLLDLETLNEREKYWNVPRSTGVILSALVKILEARTVLEIGTSSGYSGVLLVEALSHTRGMLYTVESHLERYEVARQSFERAGVQDFVLQIKGHAPEILKEIDSKVMFDMVFLDATKMEYGLYLKAILPRVRAGGLIIADNVLSHRQDVRTFMDEVGRNSGLRSFELDIDNGLLFVIA